MLNYLNPAVSPGATRARAEAVATCFFPVCFLKVIGALDKVVSTSLIRWTNSTPY